MTTLATIEADAKKYGVPALELAGVIAALLGAGGEVAPILATIEAAVKTFNADVASGVDPTTVSAHLAMFRPLLDKNDAATRLAIDLKFPDGAKP